MKKLCNYSKTRKVRISNGVKVAAIVPSAGSGRRMRPQIDKSRPCTQERDKPFIKLCGKEIIYYALKTLQDSPIISEIIIPTRGKNIPRIKRLIRRKGFTKVKEVVTGGRKRSLSVFNALSRVSPDIDFVLVHDAVRPFITQDLIRRTVNAAKRYGASLSTVKVSPTIKEAGLKGLLVKRTLDRKLLWEAQTPQVFRSDLLTNAYRKFGENSKYFTDEASLIEKTGEIVKMVRGSYNNIKITTPLDLITAEAIIKSCKL